MKINLARRKDLLYSIFSGVFLIAGWILQHIVSENSQSTVVVLFLMAYASGGFLMSIDLTKNLAKGKLDIDLLMALAAIGAALLGRWAEGALLLFLFSMGHALEHLALDKANSSIAALARLKPTKALKIHHGQIVEIPIEDLSIGDHIVVKPNTTIAADGIVVKGSGDVDQSSITGESIPADKAAIGGEWSIGDDVSDLHRVYSGTMNGQGYMEILVTKNPSETTLARLIRMVEEAKENKTYAQEFTARFEKYYVPVVLIFVGILLLSFLFFDEPFSSSFYRAMTVMVVASPCALVISTPSAVLCGIAKAAKMGVLIKGGKPLVDLGTLDTIVFDKTGTLTRGKPVLTDFILINGALEQELIPAIIALEEKSNHPLAPAIVLHMREKYQLNKLPEVSNFRSLTGYGIKGVVEGLEWAIGNTELFIGMRKQPVSDGVIQIMTKLQKEGKTAILVSAGDQFKALLGIMDLPRAENVAMVKDLRTLGVERIIMLSGDKQSVAESVGRKLGIDESLGDLLPEDKMNFVASLVAQQKRVAMVGDGVNDAPAMANSTVSVAMGAAGNDVALETADIALMSEQLERLPLTMKLSRKTKSIIRQNIFVSIGVILIMIPLAIIGMATIGPAVAIHEGSTIAVAVNALRILK